MLFDEINKIESQIVGKKTSDIEDDLFEFFVFIFLIGSEEGNKMLKENFVANSTTLKKELERKYEEKDYKDLVREYAEAEDYVSLNRVIETTAHRLYNAAILDIGNRSNKKVYKTWKTILDDRTRDTHYYLNGMKKPLNEEFFTFDGDHAQYPGGFQTPQNNCNCRCQIMLSTE